MKKISLTQDQFAAVDNSDFEWLNQWKWYALWCPDIESFYALRNEPGPGGKQQVVRMHREILGLKRGDKRQADHIQHNTLDNRRSQLRIVTHTKNHWNRKAAKGYYWKKKDGKYSAQIMVRGKSIPLGQYNQPKKARAAYVAAKKKYHVI